MCDSALIIAEKSINPHAVLFPRGIHWDSSLSVPQRLCRSYLLISARLANFYCCLFQLSVRHNKKKSARFLSPTTLFCNSLYSFLRRLRATHFHPLCSAPARFSLVLFFLYPPSSFIVCKSFCSFIIFIFWCPLGIARLSVFPTVCDK